MAISRRGFLGLAAAAPAALLARKSWAQTEEGEAKQPAPDCLLINSQLPGLNGESFAGYRAALTASGVAFGTSSNTIHDLAARCIILPEAVFVNAGEVEWIRNRLEKGTTVLLEAGAAFLSSTEFNFQRRLLKLGLGLNLRPAVDVWARDCSAKQVPYIDYEWPATVKIRDFSRVIPVGSAGSEAIAWLRGIPLAVKHREGKGTMVFLGSPIGPHLLAGDREASRWLSQFCASV